MISKQEYYDGINDPDVNTQGYLCDRCNTQPLNDNEYCNFVNFHGGSYHYCNECWNWIHLMKWTDKDGHYHTLRSERR